MDWAQSWSFGVLLSKIWPIQLPLEPPPAESLKCPLGLLEAFLMVIVCTQPPQASEIPLEVLEGHFGFLMKHIVAFQCFWSPF